MKEDVPMPGLWKPFLVSLAQLFYAIGFVIISRKLSTVSGLLLNWFAVAIAAVVLLPVPWFCRREIASWSGEIIGWVVALGIIWTVLAETLYILGAQDSDTSTVAILALLFPIFVASIERFLGEPLDTRFFIEAAVMFAGYLIIVTRQ
jgi:drug/metabolite transporter (DMT)-like permease